MATDRRFTGQREETAIGLYDYKARYYDPVLGRFIQADTIVPEPGNPQALNRYAYVVNSPLKLVDPTGHWYCGDHYNPACVENQEEARLYSKLSRDQMILRQWEIIPGQPVTNARLEQAHKTKFAGLILGAGETTLSAVGTFIKGGTLLFALLDGVQPGPADAVSVAAAVQIYKKGFEPVENLLGWASLANTVQADIEGGFTYRDQETQELVIGQNTVEDLGYATAGQATAFIDNVWWPAGILSGPIDSYVNVSTVIDDARGFMRSGQPTWEFRLSVNLNPLELSGERLLDLSRGKRETGVNSRAICKPGCTMLK